MMSCPQISLSTALQAHIHRSAAVSGGSAVAAVLTETTRKILGVKRHCTLSQWLCHTNNGWGRTATNILTKQTSFSKIKHQSLFLKLIARVTAASKSISVTVSSAIHDFSWALQLPDFPHTDGQSLEPRVSAACPGAPLWASFTCRAALPLQV